MTPQIGSETAMEIELGYLPKCEREWVWFVEGICCGASIILAIDAAILYWRIV